MNNSNFKYLISKMNNLQEIENEKLKGGIAILKNLELSNNPIVNYNCPCGYNVYCPEDNPK